jgi:hypothetical protein
VRYTGNGGIYPSESTRVIAEFAERNGASFFLSIDNHAEYLRKVAECLPLLPFLQFQYLELQGPCRSQDDHGCSYSSYPAEMGHCFDFILIDGRRRMECALVAARVLSPNGRVLLHDWRRSRYAIVRDLFDVEEIGTQFPVLRPKARRTEPPVRVCDEKRAIFIVLQGTHAEAQFAVTEPFFRNYAHRIQADLSVIRADPAVPRAALKTLVLQKTHEYERLAILDVDIIIRSNAPDIFHVVPPDRLGVMVEGQRIDRGRECEELTKLYGQETTFPTEQYFNTGVLVMSREHIPLLEKLRKGPILGHPQFEQGLLNILVRANAIPIYDLPMSLNHILHPDFGMDWRYGSFIHLAGAGKQAFKLSKVRTEEIFDGARCLSSRDFKASFVRLPRLFEIASQVSGKEVRIFDADDLVCDMPASYHELVDETLLVSLGLGLGLGPSRKAHAVWGPYAPLRAGRWQVSVLDPCGSALLDPRVTIDVCRSAGKQLLLPSTVLDREIVVDIPDGVTDIETRLAISEGRVRILAIRLERHDDAQPDRRFAHTVTRQQRWSGGPFNRQIGRAARGLRAIFLQKWTSSAIACAAGPLQRLAIDSDDIRRRAGPAKL